MAGTPKKRWTPGRRNQRRKHNTILKVPQVQACPKCRYPKLPHRVCMHCGMYRGRDYSSVVIKRNHNDSK